MNDSDIPTKLPIRFGENAGGTYIHPIPVNSQIGIVDGAASLHDGFVPLNATPIAAGGVPPSIQDMNGILYEVSGWSRWAAAGGPVIYDGGFAAAIGGYPAGAILRSATAASVFYVSTANGNTTDPEGVGAANWTRLVAPAASAAEALAGTVTDKYISPAVLATLRTTIAEVLAGTAGGKFLTPSSFYGARADAAAILAGTDDHAYLTPLGLATAFGGASGSQYFRIGSKIVQWGHDPTTVNNTGVIRNTNFNVPFSGPAEAIVTWVWDTTTRTYNQKKLRRAGLGTNTSFPWKLMDDDSGDAGSYIYGFDWIAIGPA